MPCVDSSLSYLLDFSLVAIAVVYDVLEPSYVCVSVCQRLR